MIKKKRQPISIKKMVSKTWSRTALYQNVWAKNKTHRCNYVLATGPLNRGFKRDYGDERSTYFLRFFKNKMTMEKYF